MSHMSAAAAAGVGGAPLAVAHRPCKSQADVCEGAGEPTHLEDCAFKTVFLNDELLVVDKPHYVRLQGDFAVTVLKLVGVKGSFLSQPWHTLLLVVRAALSLTALTPLPTGSCITTTPLFPGFGSFINWTTPHRGCCALG